MEWLSAIVKGLCSALFGWGQSQAEKPKVMTDANTPENVRDDLNGDFNRWLRDKKNRDN